MSTALPIAARAEDDRKDSFCHFDREGLQARRVEKSCAFAYRKTNFFSPCSALLYRSRQDPSTDARDDRDGRKYSLLHPQFYILHFTFYISKEILRLRGDSCPRSAQDDRKGERLLRLLLYHPELVVARLCCQHFADGKMLDLQGGSSSSQKSRCAAIFGSPVL